MKRVLLLVAVLVSIASTANAWSARQDEAAVILATKYLTPKALAFVQEHLGDSYGDDVGYLYKLEKNRQSPYTKSVHKLHLNADLTPKNVDGDDALKGLEQALEVVREHEKYSSFEVIAALRAVINLMCDIHNFANVCIDGVPHSQGDFKFQIVGGRKGP